jgi:hypothetical protein
MNILNKYLEYFFLSYFNPLEIQTCDGYLERISKGLSKAYLVDGTVQELKEKVKIFIEFTKNQS